jgi:hypothetical protein
VRALLVLVFATQAYADARGEVEALLARTVDALAAKDDAALRQQFDPYAIVNVPERDARSPTIGRDRDISIAIDATRKRAWFHGRIDGGKLVVLGMAVDNGGWKHVGLMIAPPSPDLRKSDGMGTLSPGRPLAGDARAGRLLESWITHGALAAHRQSTAVVTGPKGHERDVETWKAVFAGSEAIRSGRIAFAKVRVMWPESSTSIVPLALGVILVDDRWVAIGVTAD